jgi:hypothetical protein
MVKEFVLVHGMSHGAWAWASVQTRLEAAGHRVLAVDLPGHGRRAHERARASIDSYAQAVTDAMALAGFHRAIVVGHSMAGAVIPVVAERAPRWLGDLPPGDPRVVDALARLTPQPIRPWLERVDLRRFYAMNVPRTYVRCLRDAAVSPVKAGEYAARLGVVPIDLDCAHDLMLSRPDALVAILEKC